MAAHVSEHSILLKLGCRVLCSTVDVPAGPFGDSQNHLLSDEQRGSNMEDFLADGALESSDHASFGLTAETCTISMDSES